MNKAAGKVDNTTLAVMQIKQNFCNFSKDAIIAEPRDIRASTETYLQKNISKLSI